MHLFVTISSKVVVAASSVTDQWRDDRMWCDMDPHPTQDIKITGIEVI